MSSHLSKTEYEIMEYFWGMGDKYTFGELMKYFNETFYIKTASIYKVK